MAAMKKFCHKYDIEKFDGTSHFTMWQRRVESILIKEKLDLPL